jgi:hypothetical protein
MKFIKTIITGFLSLGTFGIFSSCTTVEQREPATHTTTTTAQTTVSRPTTNTVETKTTRSSY